METSKLKNIIFIALILIVILFYILAFFDKGYKLQEEKNYCYLMVADENSTAFGAKTDECDMLYSNCVSEVHNIDCEWKNLADDKGNIIAVCQCNA